MHKFHNASIVFYQPFHARCSISPSFRQRDFHVSIEFVTVAVQVPDLVVHYTIAFVVYHHGTSHTYSTCNTVTYATYSIYQSLKW